MARGISIIFILTFTNQTWAKLDPHKMQPVPRLPAAVEPMSYAEKWRYIPDDLPFEKNTQLAFRKFADRTLDNWWRDHRAKNTPIVHQVDNVEKKMRAEVSFGKNESVEHKFSLRILAVQATAHFTYNGWTNTEFRYDSRTETAAIELSERVWGNKSLVLGHYKDPRQSTNSLGLSWPW